jgi:hypothetical protein
MVVRVDPVGMVCDANPKFTVWPLTGSPEPFVTVTVRMLLCPDERALGDALNDVIW